MGYHITFCKRILMLCGERFKTIKQLTLGIDFSSFLNETLVTGTPVFGNVHVQIYYCLIQDGCLCLIFSLIKLKIQLLSLQLYIILTSSQSMKMCASNPEQKAYNNHKKKTQYILNIYLYQALCEVYALFHKILRTTP